MYLIVTSLGIVSASLYLAHTYSLKPMNAKAVKVFEGIHYVLFFVAIINAMQCCILYYLTLRVAHRDWVRVENIDIDHYVAIRQRFITVSEQLRSYEDREKRRASKTSLSLSAHLNKGLATTFWVNLYDFFHHPRLLLKYRKLLVHIRFHELRVQLIESNKLPSKFKVSEYLRQCLKHVFISFIEISALAWLTLLGMVNLLYFICGILTVETSDLNAAGSMLAFIYIFHPLVFIIVTLVIFSKVKRIFKHIIFSHLSNEHYATGTECSSMKLSASHIGDYEKEHQRALFWFGNPLYIVAAAQYMLFGL